MDFLKKLGIITHFLPFSRIINVTKRRVPSRDYSPIDLVTDVTQISISMFHYNKKKKKSFFSPIKPLFHKGKSLTVYWNVTLFDCLPALNLQRLLGNSARIAWIRKTNLGDAWELDTNLILTILPLQNGGQTWRKTWTYWTQAKITARYKKVVSTVQKLNLFHFRKIFPKNREIGSLVVRLWEMTKNRETHGRTVRVGKSV